MFMEAELRGTFLAAFTGTESNPVRGQVSLSDAQMLKLFGEWLKEHPDWHPPRPEPTPEEIAAIVAAWHVAHPDWRPEGWIEPVPPAGPPTWPLPIGMPDWLPDTGGRNWNVDAEGDIAPAVQKLLDQNKPVVIGPGDCTNSKPWRTRNFHIRGSGRTRTNIRSTAPMFETVPAAAVTQSYLGHLRLYGPGTADACPFYGFSNGSHLDNVEWRGWKNAILLMPAGSDKSTAWVGYITSPFSFTHTESFLKVVSGNGASRSNCLLMIVAADVGRCNGPVMQFHDLNPVESNIVLWQCNMDRGQSPNGKLSPQYIWIGGSEPMSPGGPRLPITIIGGHIEAIGDGNGALLESPHELAASVTGINVGYRRLKPTSADVFMEWAVKTANLNIPGNANFGTVNLGATA